MNTAREIKQGSQFYNQDEVNVTEFVKDGRTIIYENKSDALERIKNKKTYQYEMFILRQDNGCFASEKAFYGHAVAS